MTSANITPSLHLCSEKRSKQILPVIRRNVLKRFGVPDVIICGNLNRMSPETHTHTEAKSSALRSFKPRNKRKILCACPRYSYSFGTFNHAFPLMGDVKGFMPPQGILVITAMIPEEWEVKFIDENIARVTPEEFAWADVVFVSGMHIQ